MVGLQLIEHMDGLSDDAVCARFLDSPFVQLLPSESDFQHTRPLDRSSMSRRRRTPRAAARLASKIRRASPGRDAADRRNPQRDTSTQGQSRLGGEPMNVLERRGAG
jgi:IS5 family transposase